MVIINYIATTTLQPVFYQITILVVYRDYAGVVILTTDALENELIFDLIIRIGISP